VVVLRDTGPESARFTPTTTGPETVPESRNVVASGTPSWPESPQPSAALSTNTFIAMRRRARMVMGFPCARDDRATRERRGEVHVHR